jgi:hypothetical protein
MSTARARTAHAKAILGPELHAQLPHTKVLLVGAGGIGCELCEYSQTDYGLGTRTYQTCFSEEYRANGLWEDHTFGPRYH